MIFFLKQGKRLAIFINKKEVQSSPKTETITLNDRHGTRHEDTQNHPSYPQKLHTPPKQGSSRLTTNVIVITLQ
jgi:hypothetical protein